MHVGGAYRGGAYRGAYVRRGVGVGIGAAAVGAAVIAPRYYTVPGADIMAIRPAIELRQRICPCTPFIGHR